MSSFWDFFNNYYSFGLPSLSGKTINFNTETTLGSNKWSFHTAYNFSERALQNEINSSLRYYPSPAKFKPCGEYISLNWRTFNTEQSGQIVGDSALGFYSGKKIYLTSSRVDSDMSPPEYKSANLYMSAQLGAEYRFKSKDIGSNIGINMGVEF